MNEAISSFRDVSNTNRYYTSRFRAFRAVSLYIKLSHFDSNWVIEIPVTLRKTSVISSTKVLKDIIYNIIINSVNYRDLFMRLYHNLSSHKTPDRGTLHNYDKKELRF